MTLAQPFETKTKAKPAPDYDGKKAWWGYYWQDGKWIRVCNRDGNPIIYARPSAAIAAAWFEAP